MTTSRLIPVILLLGAGASAQTLLTPDSHITAQMAGGGEDRYRLTLAPGEFAAVAVEQQGIDVVVSVFDANARPIADYDSESRAFGRENVGLVSDVATTYELRVHARYPRSAAAFYTISYAAPRTATEANRALFQAHVLFTQAIAANTAGKGEEALKLAEQAAVMARQGEEPEGAYYGEALWRWAAFLRTRGDYRKSMEIAGRAIAVTEKAVGHDCPLMAMLVGLEGELYLDQNDLIHAEPLIEEELAITERTLGPNHPRVPGCLMDLGLLYKAREEPERAVPMLRRALDIAEQTMAPGEFTVMALSNNLGDLYTILGDYAHAVPLLESALEMIEKKYGRDHPYVTNPLQNLGSIARKERQYSRALELYTRAEAVREKSMGARHPQTLALLLNIGNVYTSQRDYAKALDFDQRALDGLTAAVGPYHNLTVLALGNLARTYAAAGDAERAIEFEARYDAAQEKNIAMNLELGSESEKLSYLEAVAPHTDRTISMCIGLAPGNLQACDLAATALLQRKGRALDAASASVASLRQRLDEGDRRALDNLAETNRKLATLTLNGPGKLAGAEYDQQVQGLQGAREKLEREISGRSAQFRAETLDVSLAAVQAAIPAGAALIEFTVYRPFDFRGEDEDAALGEPRYAAYVLRHEGHALWSDLGPLSAIDGAIGRWREALRDPRRDVRPQGRALYAKLIEPLHGALGTASRWLISPDGELNLVPFEALVDARGLYVVERRPVAYLSSGRDLLRLQVVRASRGAPVIVADPQFDSEASLKPAPAAGARPAQRSVTSAGDLRGLYFAPLDGTAEEAKAIQSRFADAIALTGSRASKSALMKVDAPRILHIATHGFFLEGNAARKIENPLLRSGLALAGANRVKSGDESGILTALEASGLNLWGAKLVTLSACDTGVGEVKNGEGVYGLRRAFMLAGAETLVMTLWPVSDYATREVMTDYYGGLQRKLGRGDALRAAQLAMLHRSGRRHPFYWAAYIESGEWRGLSGN